MKVMKIEENKFHFSFYFLYIFLYISNNWQNRQEVCFDVMGHIWGTMHSVHKWLCQIPCLIAQNKRKNSGTKKKLVT